MLVVDLGDPPTGPPAPTGVVVAVGSAADIASSSAQPWIERATFTLSEDAVTDRRVVTVESTATATRRADHPLRDVAAGGDRVRRRVACGRSGGADAWPG